VLPDRGMEASIRLYAVIVRPFLARGLLPRRCERRDAFPVLRIFDNEAVRGVCQRDDVVTLSEKMHRFAVENLQHFAIGRHVVGVQERLARDRYQLGIKDSLTDPIGVPAAFVPMIGPQHSFENRLALSLGVRGSGMFVSTRRRTRDSIGHSGPVRKGEATLPDVPRERSEIDEFVRIGSATPGMVRT
jgi:hypothetical protein